MSASDAAPTVRRATAADVPALARTLSAAFRDDPWTRWTIDEQDHEHRVRETYALVLGEVALPFGEVWTTHDRAAVAAWAWTDPVAEDPEGHQWSFAQRVRDVPPEEMQQP